MVDKYISGGLPKTWKFIKNNITALDPLWNVLFTYSMYSKRVLYWFLNVLYNVKKSMVTLCIALEGVKDL